MMTNFSLLAHDPYGSVPLNDVMAAGPVQNGFYVASGPMSLVGTVMESLVELLHQESRSRVNNLGRWDFATKKVGRLFWIDSGNCFDPYFLARLAVRKGLDPKRVLRAIHVARPFTAFQFQQMMEKVPPISTLTLSSSSPRERVAEGRGRGVVTTQWMPLVVVSDLMGLFYDAEIQERDVERAFHQFKAGLSLLKKRAVVLALLRNHEPPVSRRHFLPAVLHGARRVATSLALEATSSGKTPFDRREDGVLTTVSWKTQVDLPLAANQGW